MKVNNKSFNEWLEKDYISYDDNMEEYRTLNGYFSMGVANTTSTTYNELIGLMLIWLLDKGCGLCKSFNSFIVWDKLQNTIEQDDLYTALKQAIESIKE